MLDPQGFEEQWAENDVRRLLVPVLPILGHAFECPRECSRAHSSEAIVIENDLTALPDRSRSLARAYFPQADDSHLEQSRERVRGVERLLTVPSIPVPDIVLELSKGHDGAELCAPKASKQTLKAGIFGQILGEKLLIDDPFIGRGDNALQHDFIRRPSGGSDSHEEFL